MRSAIDTRDRHPRFDTRDAAGRAPGFRASGEAGFEDARAEIARLERFAGWLGARFRIPFTPVRFGWDWHVGVVPGLGDVATLLPSLYLIYRAWRLGLPAAGLARMGANVALDSIVGALPPVGDVFDLVFKSNRRNAGLLRRHLEARAAPPVRR